MTHKPIEQKQNNNVVVYNIEQKPADTTDTAESQSTSKLSGLMSSGHEDYQNSSTKPQDHDRDRCAENRSESPADHDQTKVMSSGEPNNDAILLDNHELITCQKLDNLGYTWMNQELFISNTITSYSSSTSSFSQLDQESNNNNVNTNSIIDQSASVVQSDPYSLQKWSENNSIFSWAAGFNYHPEQDLFFFENSHL